LDVRRLYGDDDSVREKVDRTLGPRRIDTRRRVFILGAFCCGVFWLLALSQYAEVVWRINQR